MLFSRNYFVFLISYTRGEFISFGPQHRQAACVQEIPLHLQPQFAHGSSLTPGGPVASTWGRGHGRVSESPQGAAAAWKGPGHCSREMQQSQSWCHMQGQASPAVKGRLENVCRGQKGGGCRDTEVEGQRGGDL